MKSKNLQIVHQMKNRLCR